MSKYVQGYDLSKVTRVLSILPLKAFAINYIGLSCYLDQFICGSVIVITSV